MRNLKSKRLAWTLLFFVSIFSSCTCGKKEKQIPDVSKIEVNFTLLRFEQDLFRIDTAHLQEGLKSLSSQYGAFFDVYEYNIMQFRNPRDSSDRYLLLYKEFLSNKDVRGLYDSVQHHYSDFGPVQKDLSKAFQFYKYYFPNRSVPKVVTLISEFGTGVFTIDSSYIGIGLDLFLGDEYKYYSNFFPNYIQAKLKREFIVPNTMKVMYNQYYGDPYQKPMNLVNTMIEVGKQQYFLEQMMPESAEEYKFGFSTAQLEWCKASEKSIWQYFIGQDLLYKDNQIEVRKYVGEAPSTPGMPKESPGNIGAWVGYQIVSAYMNKMGDKISLERLCETDPEIIMQKSAYKPAK